MSFFRLYLRVLDMLGVEGRLAAVLAVANIALALALAPLIGAWVAFGLFTIIAGALVAWFADRMAHRRRNLVLADFFEHVLHMPLSYHAGTHSGRQLKIMLTGTDTLWWLWVSFFREHFSAFVFIVVLLPAAILLNWRLAIPLLALAVIFTAVTVLVMQKAEAMQRAVERHYSDLAETAADTLGNVALVQSFARI